jgi:hypothetical protein
VALDPTQSTPFGFWRFASEYLLAARAVRSAHGDRLAYPLLYLYGLSIELALKAFLLRRGDSLADVKRLSHFLGRTLSRSRRRRLGREVKLSARQIAAVRILDVTYSSNQLRYIETGVTISPPIELVAEAAELVVLGLECYCTGHTIFSRRMRPNPSLNADVPRAGLRPGSRPPVS